MRQSKFFILTKKETITQEESESAKLLLKGSFIEKLGAGIYNFLPLGFRVLKKIEKIIREEMEKIGGQELFLASLHPKEFWQKTGRWDEMTDLYKLKDGKKDLALGPTHEEIIVPLAKKIIKSYKNLPLYLFQIQTKFRKELRPKAGLLRTKEFLMKDLYSFHSSEQDLNEYYEIVKKSYFNIFSKVKIREKTYLTFASGGTFSKYSHEFQTISPSGEDTIFICERCQMAINKEIKGENPFCPNCRGKNFWQEKTIEVGNIFKLKTKFSEPFDLKFKDKDGKEKFVLMGCYGIGLGRLMGTIVEVHHDSKGIIWPESVAPFKFHLISLQNCQRMAEKIYQKMLKIGLEVLYDDREKSAGEKFFDSDLIGIPFRIIISEKTLKKRSFELKERGEEKLQLIKLEKLNILKKL